MRTERPPLRGGGVGAHHALLLAVTCVLPWAFGGVAMWAYRPAAFGLVLAAAIAVARQGPASGLGLDRRSMWLLPSALLAVWGLAQIVPLPAPVVRILSPGAHRVYVATVPGYPGAETTNPLDRLESDALARVPESAEAPPPRDDGTSAVRLAAAGRWTGWRPLSLQPSATLERLAWFVALLSGFLVAVRGTTQRPVWRRYRRVLFVLFAVLAVEGLLQHRLGQGKILWIRAAPEDARPFGPYVDPSHFAGVMELAVPWMAGHVLGALRRGGLRTRTRRPTFFVAAAGGLLGGAAIVATASRFGTVAVAVSLLILALSSATTRRQRAVILAATGVAVTAAAVFLRDSLLGQRLSDFWNTLEFSDRTLAWRQALHLVGDFPLTGTGFGSFRTVFPSYLLPGEYAQWFQLHNDYLEVVLEGGWVAAALLVWLLWGYARRLLGGGAEGGLRRSPERLGLVLGLTALALHAFVEFNHQMPANALLFVVAAAMALNARRGNERESKEASR